MPGMADLDYLDSGVEDGPSPTEIENLYKLDNSENPTYQIGGVEAEGSPIQEIDDFNQNLAEIIDEDELDFIASELMEGIDNDIKSREEWESSYNRGMKYAGYKVEEFRTFPFKNACSAYDTTLSSALLRFWSTTRAELYPASGPCKYITYGDQSDSLEMQGEKIMKGINHYLTVIDREYYPDCDRMLMYLGLVGCAFKKVYPDPVTNYPKSRFIDPQNFIVNNNCTTILSSDRLTHREFLTKKQLKLRQMSNFYRNIPIPKSADDFENVDDDRTYQNVRNIEGIDNTQISNKSLYMVYETHADLDLKGFEHESDVMDSQKTGMPLPYIVTMLAQNRKVLSIRRNWAKEDKFYNRLEYFVQYNYLPGFGIYGLGISQILGSNAIVLTSIIRQLIDAGTLRNFPGGLKKKGLRVETNDKAIGPSEFWDVETGGLPISDVIMLMPYNEPSVVLKELYSMLAEQTQIVGNIAETKLADAKPDAPVGTTLSLMEIYNKVPSSIQRSLYTSLSNELDLLYKLFMEGLLDSYEFSDANSKNSYKLSSMDFNSNIKIIPVADPNLTTSTQRILRAEGILRLAQSAPHLHDLRNAYYRMYSAMNVDNIDKVLPPPQEVYPLDPVSENMAALENKPLKIAEWQDHPSHIASHKAMIEAKPETASILLAHIAEHEAAQYYILMQQAMNITMPPLDQLMDPQVQNMIAMKSVEASQSVKQQISSQQPAPPDPQTVMLADIAQRREAEEMRFEIAKLKTELESFKAQLRYEADKTKIESQEKIADQKSETDIALAEMKLQENLIRQ